MREDRQAPQESVAVIGAGAWGTALAVILAERYARVSLWVFEAALAERHGIEMPICRAVHRVLFEGQDPREAVVQLMTRELRFEGD